MAASIKVSELQSLTTLTDVDLFLVSDMESGTSRRVSYSDLHTNLTSGLQSALDSLTDTVGTNRVNIEATLNQIKTELVDQITLNKSVSDGSDVTLQANIDAAIAYVDQKIAEVVDFAPEDLDTLNELAAAMQDNPALITNLDTRLTGLEADPVTKAYVDQQITSVVDFAPENLDTLNELAEALGDNPQVITSLQSDLDAYKAHIEDRNLQLALAYDVPTYAEIIYGG